MRFIFWMFVVSFLYSCNPASDASDVSGGSEKSPQETITDNRVSEERLEIKKDPVASHSERTDDPLNEWYFSVKLYETPKTFHYRMLLQFEEIRGEDTLRLPNIGVNPEPVIKPGEDKYSCIIGFLDKDKNFREYKKVHVKSNSLKVTTLKHYAVTTR